MKRTVAAVLFIVGSVPKAKLYLLVLTNAMPAAATQMLRAPRPNAIQCAFEALCSVDIGPAPERGSPGLPTGVATIRGVDVAPATWEVAVPVGVAVPAAVGVPIAGVDVGVGVGDRVPCSVAEGVGVLVGRGVFVIVGVFVGVNVGVNVGVSN